MATQADYRTRPARTSFAERAAQNPGLDLDDDQYDAPVSSTKKHSVPREHRQNVGVHRTREPQAALHVPKPRNAVPDSDSEGPDQAMRGLTKKPGRPTVQIPSDTTYRGPHSGTIGTTPTQRVHRNSLPDRSPLQKLEGRFDGMSKEDKRARMQDAEMNAQRRRAERVPPVSDPYPDQHNGRRHVSDGNSGSMQRPRRDNGGGSQRHATDPRRRSQGYDHRALMTDPEMQYGQQPASNRRSLAEDGRRRFSQASEALRAHSNPSSQEDDDEADQDNELYRRSSKSMHRRAPTDGQRQRPASGEVYPADRRNNGPRREDPNSTEPTRSNSKRLQKRGGASSGRGNVPESHQHLQTARMEDDADNTPVQSPGVDVLPVDAVKNTHTDGPTYRIPPQTATAIAAKARVDPGLQANGRQGYNSASPLTPRGSKRQSMPARAFDEWRNAPAARLELDDLALDDAIIGRQGSHRKDRRSRNSGQFEHLNVESSQGYQPTLLVRCGPLLRYTGLRRERRSRHSDGATVEREIWRGSVMIVTDDQHSSYSAPTLKLFAQPMELLPTLPHDMRDELPSDYVDPIAGQVNSSPTGRPTFVKPIESIPEGVDLSQKDIDDGIFESYRSSSNKWRVKANSGEKLGKSREVKGARLHAERGLTFWRFNIEVELGISQARLAYRINNGPATGFWVPARGQTMNIMFHSCNGFSLSVNSDDFSGPDPLWRDVLNSHNMKPYHVMIGGGDQIYNDRVTVQTELFKEWLAIKNPEHKHHAEFTREMQDELETFYLNRYAMWFSQGLFGMANSQIPMVNLWDDHDIIDGFGSYPDHFMKTKVFTGLGTIAFKYYMLFQHQSVSAETFQDEASWILGASPGPYIHQHSRSVFMFLGRKVAFLGLDCRTERRRDEVLCQETYDQVFNRCRAEIVKGETKHLIVLLTVPIAYPRLNFLENMLTSRVMDPIKAIGRTGALGGFVNKFDGGVEILDDLDDHWTAKHHKQERNWFIQELQQLAAEKSVRITILGGDVHLGAIGQFFSPRKHGIPKDQDHRYMPNVVSSAIVNTPPPVMMSDVLNRRNKLHHLDDETDEDMIQMFSQDVDGKPRNNKTLMPRRNYCTIREYVPGSTPPHSPDHSRPNTPPEERFNAEEEHRRRYPPGSMGQRPGMTGRSRSLTREDFRPRNLLRRLSGSRTRFPFRPDQGLTYEEEEQERQRSSSAGPARVDRESRDSYFPDDAANTNTRGNVNSSAVRSESRPSNMFRRRPSDLADNRRHNGEEDDDHDPDAINLEGGLDICLNMEVSQHDPAGITMPYRLLVPALFYGGSDDVNTTRFKTRRASLMDRIRGRGRNRRDSISSDERSQSGSRRSLSPQRQAGVIAQPRRTVSQQTHPDDQLRFADQVPSRQPSGKDHRRDSSIAGIGNDGHQQAYMTPAQLSNSQRLHKDEPMEAVAPAATKGSRPMQHSGTAPLPQGNYDEEEGDYSEDERPRRKLGFLGSMRRRFSSFGRRGDDYQSGDDSDGDFSGSEPDYKPAPRPPPNSNKANGPHYRPADEAIYRNDARLPSSGSNHGGFGNRTSVSTANTAQRRPVAQQSAGVPGQTGGRTSLDRRPLPTDQRAGAGHQAAALHNVKSQEMTEDGNSMTFSDLESLEGNKKSRRASKAERFFGTGEQNPPARPQQGRMNQGDEEYDSYEGSETEDERPRRSWQFWKRGERY